MKLCMETPVLYVFFLWEQIEYRSKVEVKITKNIKTTVWAITLEPEVVETYDWLQNVPDQNSYQKCPSRHDLRRTVFFASHDVK